MTDSRLHREVLFLKAYAVCSTLVFASLFLVAFRAPPGERQRFTEIDVERINVIEADGRYAVVISNEARLPGGIMDGTESSDRQGDAGLLFYNSEGDEAGGLIFHSARNPDGMFQRSYGQLSLDRFESDQVVTMRYWEDDEGWSAGLHASDFPRHVIAEWAAGVDSINRLPEAEQGTAMAALRRRFMAEGKWEVPRLFVGERNRAATLEMRDTQGRSRIRMVVDSLDVARLEFLDSTETVVRRLPDE